MKRTARKILLIVTGMLSAAVFVFSAGCGKTDVPEEKPPVEIDTEMTLENAYENNRPDYDGMFDYGSGYTPSDPAEAEQVTVTMEEGSLVTFAGGATTLQVKKGDVVPSDAFDTSAVADVRELAGFAATDADGKVTMTSIDDCRIWSDSTLTPYFSAEAGFAALTDLGSGKNGYFNYDGMPGSFAETKTMRRVTNELVRGGEGGYAEIGCLLDYTGSIARGSAFRLDTRHTVPEGVWEVAYNFENKGNSPIHLDVYQVSKGAEHNFAGGSTTFEANRYRVDVDLDPGESMRGVGQYYLATNTNILPLVVADRAMENMKLGMSVSVKQRTDLSAPEPEYTPSLEPDPTAKVLFALPDGMTISEDYNNEIVYGAPVTMPAASQITDPTGRGVGGWYRTDTQPIEFIGSGYAMPEHDITVAPYYAPAAGDMLVFGSGSADKLPVASAGNEGDIGTDGFTGTDVVESNERGVRISYGDTLAAGVSLTYSTRHSASVGRLYRYDYTFINHGESDITLEVSMPASEEAATSVTIGAGQSRSLSVSDARYASSVTTTSTVLRFGSGASGMDLTVLMSAEDTGADVQAKTYTLTIGGDTDVTFMSGGKTAELNENASLPAVNGNGWTIAGWLNSEGEKIDAFTMPASSTTIYPYFTAKEGFTALPVIGSNKFNYDGMPGSFAETKKMTRTTNELIKGERDYTEIGSVLTYVGSIEKGSAVRMDTTCNITAGVWEVAYNFENKGDTPIYLDVYQVSKGAEHNFEGGSTTFETNRYRIDVNLKPGESMRGVGQYSLTANGNILPLFVADKAMDGMKLGISMSVKLRSDLSTPETVVTPDPDDEETPPAGDTYTLTIGGDTDVTFASGGKTAELSENASLPAVNGNGWTIAGWLNSEGEKIDAFTMPASSTTIYPYFTAKEGFTALPVIGSNKFNYDGMPGSFAETKKMTRTTNELIKGERDYTEIGSVLTYVGSIEKGSAVRMDTTCNITAGVWEVAYNFENKGDTPIYLDVYQVSKGAEHNFEGGSTTFESNRYRIDVNLKPGESMRGVGQYYLTANGNVIPLFVADKAMDGMKLGISMSVKLRSDLSAPETVVTPDPDDEETPPATDTYTLTIGGSADVTFASGGKTATINAGDPFPEVTNSTGRTLKGWYGENGEIIDTSAISTDTTVYPYFEFADGYKRLWLGNARNDGIPDKTGYIQGTQLISSNFKPLTTGSAGFGKENPEQKAIVEGGAGGFAEEGMVLEYSGNVPADEGWRCDSVINGGENPITLKVGSTYDYSFNFRNMGDYDLSFTIYIINSAQNTSSCSNNEMTVELERGESTTITMNDVLYVVGSTNNNMLMRFVSAEDMTNGFKLGVAMSVKLPV